MQFLNPVVVTISEILTTHNLIPVLGKPHVFIENHNLYHTPLIPGIFNSGGGNDFGNLHFFKIPGITVPEVGGVENPGQDARRKKQVEEIRSAKQEARSKGREARGEKQEAQSEER